MTAPPAPENDARGIPAGIVQPAPEKDASGIAARTVRPEPENDASGIAAAIVQPAPENDANGIAARTGRAGAPEPAAAGETPAPPRARPEAAALTRRATLKLLGALPLAPAITALPGMSAAAWPADGLARAAAHAAAARDGETPPALRFLTPHEHATVRVLADMVIPADEHSGSATDAGVPEFMDFMLADGAEDHRVAFRGGLAWLDTESRRRSGAPFLAAAATRRTEILDDIAWPAKAPPGLAPGVAFFNRFRDLAAAGFFSSEMGHRDLGFQGNVPVPEWKGCGARADAHALREVGGEGAGAG